jgi:Zn-dependent peptidase ImmA (M78 family)
VTTSALPPVNPSVIAWALADSGYELERVAKRLNVSPDRVRAWAAGALQPTIRQVQNLAAFVRRPVTVFFLPTPPQVAPLAAEYRRLSGVVPGQESPELRLALRQMINRHERAVELSDELGIDPPALGIQAAHHEAPPVVAARLRARLGISDAEQLAWRDGWQAWRHWRSAVESIGVLVFQFPSVALTEVRGLALLRQPLPVIGINSKEAVPESRVFTLIHELAHLALAAANEETTALNDRHDDQGWSALERFAESVASHTILPSGVLDTILRASPNPAGWDVPNIRQFARRAKLTPLALATRLHADGRMTTHAYQAWRRDWDAWVENHPVRGGGFAHPDRKALGRNGRPFVRLVFDALSQNRITATDAARYLDLRYEHFQKLTNRLVGPIDLWDGDA